MLSVKSSGDIFKDPVLKVGESLLIFIVAHYGVFYAASFEARLHKELIALFKPLAVGHLEIAELKALFHSLIGHLWLRRLPSSMLAFPIITHF